MSNRVALVGVAAAVLVAGGVAVASPDGTGLASWYGAWHEGRLMSNGCKFHAASMTAASRTIPLGTWVRVRSLRNDRVVTVVISDRGPYVRGRIIDVSRRAAEMLDMITAGVIMVQLERLPPPPGGVTSRPCRV